MALSRDTEKSERVTITLVPTGDEKSFPSIPSTFSPANRTYVWRHFGNVEYMIVPRKISSNEIKVDMFLYPIKKGRMQGVEIQKVVQTFVKNKIEHDWHGLKLANISRATAATPPERTVIRGTIEEILGTELE